MKEGFGAKDNEAYDTAIQFTSSLPFKKNIEKNYNSIINKFFKKKKDLYFYRDYLIDTWGPYFRNNTLNLCNVEKIFRTNNALENYNRIFKNLINMQPNMLFSLFIIILKINL